MSEIRKRTRALFCVSLFILVVRPALVLPGSGLADDRKISLDARVDKPALSLVEGTGGTEEEASLTDEALRLEAVIAYAQEHNPTIRAAQSRLQAAQQVPPQASAYDDPMVMWDNWNAPESLRIDKAGNNIFRLSQKIPFPGKLRLKGEIAAKEAEQKEAELGATAIDTIAQVKKAYYEIWLGYQNLNVYRRDQGLVTQFAQITERK